MAIFPVHQTENITLVYVAKCASGLILSEAN